MSATTSAEGAVLRARPAHGWPPEAVAAVEQLRLVAAELHARAEQLQRALASRIVIEQAKGVLAERLALGPDDAFELLRRAARSSQTRIHDLAAEVVASRRTPPAVARELARRKER